MICYLLKTATIQNWHAIVNALHDILSVEDDYHLHAIVNALHDMLSTEDSNHALLTC